MIHGPSNVQCQKFLILKVSLIIWKIQLFLSLITQYVLNTYGEVKYILEYLWTEPYSDLRDQHNSSCFSLNVESTVPIEYWAEC
jgi:hypothetical protein